jgi:hypothetical protein
MATAYPDLEGIYRRVIADPRSATRADRNAVFGHPPPDEEERLCVAKTGLTLTELKEKASTDPQKLTLEGSKIVLHPMGVLLEEWEALGSEERGEVMERRYLDTSPLKALLEEAEQKLLATRSKEETTTLLNANGRRVAIENEKTEAVFQRWRDFDASMRLREGTPWIQQ